MASTMTVARDRLVGALGVACLFATVTGLLVAVANRPLGVGIVATGVALGVGGWAATR